MAHIMTCLNIVYTRTLSCPELLKKLNNCTTYCNKKTWLYVHLHWDPPKGPFKKKKRNHPLQKILTDWIFVDTSCYWKQYLSCKMSHSVQPWNKNLMSNSASVTQRCICKKKKNNMRERLYACTSRCCHNVIPNVFRLYKEMLLQVILSWPLTRHPCPSAPSDCRFTVNTRAFAVMWKLNIDCTTVRISGACKNTGTLFIIVDLNQSYFSM